MRRLCRLFYYVLVAVVLANGALPVSAMAALDCGAAQQMAVDCACDHGDCAKDTACADPLCFSGCAHTVAALIQAPVDAIFATSVIAHDAGPNAGYAAVQGLPPL